MGLAVVTVAAGGLPVVESTAGGTPVTEATNGRGVPVTKVVLPKQGMPVVFETIGAAPPFVPSTGLTGVIGWWDASVVGSVTLTADNIDSVADQSGGGRTAVWGGFNKPKYSSTGLNGRPCFNFRAAVESGSLNVTPFPMGTGNTLTAWAVCSLIDTTDHFGAANARVMGYAAPAVGDFNNIGSWCIQRPNSVHTEIDFVRNTSPFTRMTWTGGVLHTLIATVASNGLQSLYVDGSLSSIIGSPITMAGNWVTAGALCIGDSPVSTGANNYWDGPVGEVGVATGYSDAATVAQLHTYLRNKWGL